MDLTYSNKLFRNPVEKDSFSHLNHQIDIKIYQLFRYQDLTMYPENIYLEYSEIYMKMMINSMI